MMISKEMADNFFRHDSRIALLFTSGLFALFFWFGSFRYEVNDDVAITALVKGLFGLTPGAEGVFISPFLGGLLFFFYKFLPSVPWFSLLLYVGLIQLCFLASLTLLQSINSVSCKIAGLLGVATFIVLTAFQINFAAVSLLLWVTGCAYLLLSVRRNFTLKQWFWLASSQLAAAYLLRPSLLPLFLVVSAPLLFTLLSKGSRGVARMIFIPLIVAMILTFLSGMVIRHGDAYPNYVEFNKIRSDFNDTSRGLQTPQTPQALLAAKWSYEDYLVLRNWWLYDSTFFNTGQITAFLDANAPESAIFHPAAVKKNIYEYAAFFTVIFVWCMVVLLQKKLIEIRKTRGVDAFVYLYFILSVLLLMGIRFPQRIAYPCFFMLFLNFPIIFDEFREKKSSLLKNLPIVIFVVLLAYLFVPIAIKKNAEVKYIKEVKGYIDRSVMSVLESKGSESIIVDVNPHMLPTNYLPFHENDVVLKTRIMPGGWLVGSPVYFDFIKREGLDKQSTPVEAMIDNPRVVLRFWDSPQMSYESYVSKIFLRHLRQRYTPGGADWYIDQKIVKDFRQGNRGLVYFQLVKTTKISQKFSPLREIANE